MEEIDLFEEKIIEYLSLFPRRNALRIKMEIGEPFNKYSTVKTLTQMTEKGWLTYTEGRGEKKVRVKFYKLSSLGIGLALVKNPEDKLLRTLGRYKKDIPEFNTLIHMANTLPSKIGMKLIRITGQYISEKEEKARRLETLTLDAISGLEVLSKSELEELVITAKVNYAYLERHPWRNQDELQSFKDRKLL